MLEFFVLGLLLVLGALTTPAAAIGVLRPAVLPLEPSPLMGCGPQWR